MLGNNEYTNPIKDFCSDTPEAPTMLKVDGATMQSIYTHKLMNIAVEAEEKIEQNKETKQIIMETFKNSGYKAVITAA
jgi:hypothetical protein